MGPWLCVISSCDQSLVLNEYDLWYLLYISSCRPTEWPFFFGLILPFFALYLFDWIMFIVIMISICRHTRNMSVSKGSRSSQVRDFQKTFFIAMCLSIVLGLGWGVGLAATSSDLVTLTFIFQVIFSVFVGSQGVLIFVLHGLRNEEFRRFWKMCFIPQCRLNKANNDISVTNKQFTTAHSSLHGKEC